MKNSKLLGFALASLSTLTCTSFAITTDIKLGDKGIEVVQAQAAAESSNRNQVRSNLQQNGWDVVWGHNFTEGDWVEGTGAIATSVASESPKPFLQWFDYKLEQNIQKLARNSTKLTTSRLKSIVLQSLKSKRIIQNNELQLQAGFATYKRWKRVVYHEPRSYKCKQKLPFGGWTWVPCTTTKQVEKNVSLPNWHQFYVRYRLR